MKIKTKTKLIIGFSVITLSIVAILFISLRSLTNLKKTTESIIAREKISVAISKLRMNEYKAKSLSLEAIINPDKFQKDEIRKEIFALAQEVRTMFASLDTLFKRDSNYDKFLAFEKRVLNYTQMREQYERLIANGENEKAKEFMDNDLAKEFLSIKDEITGIEKSIEAQIEELKTSSSQLNITNLILGVALLFLSVLLAYYMLKMIIQIAREINRGVEVLGSSASEILSTVTEIYTGAAETATAVSETTTTVEEVRQTAMVSNQKAQTLMMSSQKAADSAERGRDSVSEVIESMKKIDEQMGNISETILRLAEQNRKIGEITSTVADIADQSNLLAVNAAIEAAKAAEHGRGFTVVAQEIRTLADQSKRATMQVKDILNEINKSVTNAVGVTQQGSATVEEGKKLVALCGEAIDVLSDNVEEATQASVQISSSNKQQMAGMEQIVPAMENIKQASEQNVNGIKQTQTAANDLKMLGVKLKEIVEKYNL